MQPAMIRALTTMSAQPSAGLEVSLSSQDQLRRHHCHLWSCIALLTASDNSKVSTLFANLL